MPPTDRFRQLLAAPGLILAPGAYDTFSARLIEAAGFPALYLGSFATSASLLGLPDVGLISQTELVEAARRITAVVDIPVLADGENGFGNAINVRRTVREFERAGVAGIHLEDCDLPKHVGRLPERVIPRDQMVQKIQAAVDARRDPNFTLIARTDAKPVNGLDDAVDRAAAYLEAGADVAFIVGLRLEETAGVVARLPKPVFNVNYFVRAADLDKAGLKIAIYPVINLLAASGAVTATLAELRATGAVEGVRDRLGDAGQIRDAIGMADVEAAVRRYGLRPDLG